MSEENKLTKQRITVEIDDLTWDNINEKLLIMYDIEKKLGYGHFYELCIGLNVDNFLELKRSAEVYNPYLRLSEKIKICNYLVMVRPR